jgi:hypothetical protein
MSNEETKKAADELIAQFISAGFDYWTPEKAFINAAIISVQNNINVLSELESINYESYIQSEIYKQTELLNELKTRL